ncbi:unnamed protein product [Paramecium sonneborni]|uniref:Uncharacterized protein n=1 Tax=Paramecium sonneborni TaxID=65129 RepID=A0A8S1RRL3_9CILI|nr:unnamed protein product [Paramecium sonneborni]
MIDINLILDETLQASYNDGILVYCEQIMYYTYVSYYQVYRPKKKCKYYIERRAGLNSVKANNYTLLIFCYFQTQNIEILIQIITNFKLQQLILISIQYLLQDYVVLFKIRIQYQNYLLRQGSWFILHFRYQLKRSKLKLRIQNFEFLITFSGYACLGQKVSTVFMNFDNVRYLDYDYKPDRSFHKIKQLKIKQINCEAQIWTIFNNNSQLVYKNFPHLMHSSVFVLFTFFQPYSQEFKFKSQNFENITYPNFFIQIFKSFLQDFQTTSKNLNIYVITNRIENIRILQNYSFVRICFFQTFDLLTIHLLNQNNMFLKIYLPTSSLLKV